MRRYGKHALVVLALLVAGGCGSSSDSEGGGPDSSDEPVAGGTLTLIQMAEPVTLDPVTLRNIASSHTAVGNALYGELVVDDANGDLAYKLAQDMVSEDGGTTWTLTLRDGLKYSDGSPMTAADVQYNWEREQDPELGSAYAETANYIASMQASGQTLNFTLTEPFANFPRAVLWSSLNWIAKPAALEQGAEAFDKSPIGAGPFVLESWTRGGDMTLVKNPNYYDAPRPYLDTLVLGVNADEGQRFATVNSGAADALISSSPALLDRGVGNGLETMNTGLSGGVMMEINTRFAPFDDPRAREAVAKAIDLDAVNQAAYEGKAEVPTTLFRETSPFFTDIPLTSYDKEGAQQLFTALADEGKPVDFTITTYDTPESQRVGEAMQAQLSTYQDVKAKLEVLDYAAAAAKVAGRSFDMISSGVYFGTDPEPDLYVRYHSGSASNRTGLSDPELDAALEASRLSDDTEERAAALAKAAERISADNTQIIYARQTHALAFDKKVKGLTLYGNTSILLDGVWIAS